MPTAFHDFVRITVGPFTDQTKRIIERISPTSDHATTQVFLSPFPRNESQIQEKEELRMDRPEK